jgi:DNA-binding NarL/FixJ family response regulator
MSKIKTVIVDDNPLFLKILSNYISDLESLKIVGTANCGEEVVELVKSVHPDLVLMDISMPGMDGIQATYKIKKLDEGFTKVIMLSFYDSPYYRQIAKAAKADGFVRKDDIITKLIPNIKSVFPKVLA